MAKIPFTSIEFMGRLYRLIILSVFNLLLLADRKRFKVGKLVAGGLSVENVNAVRRIGR